MKNWIFFILILLTVPAVGFGQSVNDLNTQPLVTGHSNNQGSGNPPVPPDTQGKFPLQVPGDFPTVAAAIRAAEDGDLILVGPGTYTGGINFNGKALVMKSTDGPDLTVIDGGQVKVVATFDSGEGRDSVLDGFTLTNGYSMEGGGVHCVNASPTLRNNKITGNQAITGGGIYIEDGSPLIENNAIQLNSADYGGGIFIETPSKSFSWPEVIDNYIAGNTTTQTGGGIHSSANASGKFHLNTIVANQATGSGGGFYCETTPVTMDITQNAISKNTTGGKGAGLDLQLGASPNIEGNRILGNKALSHGGGLACSDNSNPKILKNIISGNLADTGGKGGAIYCNLSSPPIQSNRISGNRSKSSGGGLQLENASTSEIKGNKISGNQTDENGGGMSVDNATPSLVNNLVAGNLATGKGSGVYCENTPLKMTNNTVVKNKSLATSGGLHCKNSSPEVTNSIIRENSPSQIFVESGSPVVKHSNVEGGGWPDPTNISSEAKFKPGPGGTWSAGGSYDPETHQIHLTDSSAAWLENALQGMVINPDDFQDLYLYVESNTANTITVAADWNTIETGISSVTPGSTYQVKDFHIKSGSGCIDKGDNNAPHLPTTDIDDDNRIVDGNWDGTPVVDIGVDENTDLPIFVPDDYLTIQTAIIAASSGDAILVKPGTYLENIDFLGKAVSVMSQQGPLVTVIDGNQNGSTVSFVNGETADSMLTGFTITNGSGTETATNSYTGGGIFCHNYSSPRIADNLITGNAADDGGGIGCLEYASPLITGNNIHTNSGYYGGGIFCISYCDPLIDENIITDNLVVSGGGIYLSNNTSAVVTNNRVTDNTANLGYGAGMMLNYTDPDTRIENNLIADNSASNAGAGLYFFYSSPAVTNNTITGNTISTSFGGGGGICSSSSSPMVKNCILWNNYAPLYPEILTNLGSPTFTYCDVKGGYGGTGNINADPLWVTGPEGNHYLSQIAAGQGSNSPCVNSGDFGSVMMQGTTRTDGVQDAGVVDMGYHYPCP